METRKPSTLIFLEDNHLSPLLPNVLAKLLPNVKDRYTAFYDELSPQVTATALIEQTEAAIQKGNEAMRLYESLYEQASQLMAEGSDIDLAKKILDLNKDNPEMSAAAKRFAFHLDTCVGAFTQHLSQTNQPINSEALKDFLLYAITAFKQSTPTVHVTHPVAVKNFLLSLQQNEMLLKGIDEDKTEDIDILTKAFAEATTLEEMRQNLMNLSLSIANASTGEGMMNRNKIMLSHYLQASESVMGRVGVSHVTGLQSLLLEHMSSEEAAARYTFVYCYDSPPANELQMQIRAGNASLPLEVVCVDMTANPSIDEAVNKILAAQQSKENAKNTVKPSEKPDTLKQQEDKKETLGRHRHFLHGRSHSLGHQSQGENNQPDHVERRRNSFS